MCEIIQSFHTSIATLDRAKAHYKRALSEGLDFRSSKSPSLSSDTKYSLSPGADEEHSLSSVQEEADNQNRPVPRLRRSVSVLSTQLSWDRTRRFCCTRRLENPLWINLYGDSDIVNNSCTTRSSTSFNNTRSIASVLSRQDAIGQARHTCCGNEWKGKFQVTDNIGDKTARGKLGQGSAFSLHSGGLRESLVPSRADSSIASSDIINYVINSTQVTMLSDVSIPGQTVIELVHYWGTSPGNESAAFVSVSAHGHKREINRKEVLDCASRFAYRLKCFGIGKRDIVCNALPNSLERVICEFGIQFSGAASINGQILRADGEDFKEALRTSQCCAVIVDPQVPKGARHLLLREVPEGMENNVQSSELPDLRRLILCSRNESNSTSDFLSLLKDHLLPQFAADVSPEDLATVMTTSGSTGYSKLVKLSHSNICHFGKQVKAIEPLAPADHFINCAPLGWAGGYPQWYLSCGITRYFLDMHDGPIPDLPATIWRTIVEEKIVYGFLSPMYVNAILTNSPWQTAKWKPKILCLAGQPVKKGLLDIIGKLCEAVDINYGMTECNLVTTHRIRDPSIYTDGCAGFPGYEVKIKVVNCDRKEVPQGTTGEILMWSPSLCSGYLNNDKATESAFTDDGWFCTDDAGYIGQDRKMYIEGRQSDSILRGAYILYPGWLEKKMSEFPGVKDIALVSVPDKVLYNEICACVVISDVQGVVVGKLTEQLNNHDNDDSSSKDEVDNAAFLRKKKLHNNFSGQVLVGDNENFRENGCETRKNFDDIRKGGVSKSLSVSYNDTKVKLKNISSCSHKEDEVLHLRSNHEDSISQVSDLSRFENELREFTNSLQLLHDKDAMRMVPKYYIFMETFPLTSTGKLSRKEIREIAASALGLDR